MIVALLIAHGLMAVALLGAVTHQAFSSYRPRAGQGQHGFVARYRGVAAAAFTNAIVLLFAATCLGGAFLYPQYRIDVRPALEEQQLRAANGIFEIKEHLAAVGLGVLPAYWWFWSTPLATESATARWVLTWILTVICWWNFLVGHVLNNLKGLLP